MAKVELICPIDDLFSEAPMARFCTQCGAQVDETAKFCRKCGARLTPTEPSAYSAPTIENRATNFQGAPSGFGSVQPPYQPPHQAPYQAAYQSGYDPGSAMNSKLKPNVAAMLCYPVSIVVGVIFLILTPYNRDRFIRFHAWQSILATVALAILNIAMGLLPWPLSMISRLYFSIMPLAVLGGIAWLMYRAYQYEWFKIPLLGDLAESMASKNTQ
jgi:uncharacterized membrane protein